MGKVITVHSFRRSAGRSSLVANLGVLMAEEGRKVALLDTDFQAPSLHLLLQLPEDKLRNTLNDYLWGDCGIQAVVHEASDWLNIPTPGRLYLLPASPNITHIMRMLAGSYDFEKLDQGLCELLQDLDLDYLILDAAAGLNQDTLFSMALSNTVVIMMRPDKQDYQGTAVTVEVARTLGDVRLLLVLNDIPDEIDPCQARKELESSYNCEAAALLPHSDGMLALASRGLLAQQDPGDAYVVKLMELQERLGKGD
jgi:septum site-determining protein MinD